MKRFSNLLSCIVIVIATVLFQLLPSKAIAQGNAASTSVDLQKSAKDSLVIAWMESLYEEGMKISGDTLTLSREAQLLLTEPKYRAIMYPKVYTWHVAVDLIKHQSLKRAFWYLINLYMADEKNKDLVVKSFMTYDQLFKMDKVLPATFYTYILADTEIGVVKDGTLSVTAPHIMEKKLNALKEILFYLDKYRENTATQK